MDLKNINGWRDELKDFRDTNNGKRFFQVINNDVEKNYRFVNSQIPIKLILDFIEMHFLHDEIKDAIFYRVEFGDYFDENHEIKSLVRHVPTDSDRFIDAMRTLYLFRDWYAMKIGCRYNPIVLGTAQTAACLVARGVLPSVRSQETSDWAHQKFAYANSPAEIEVLI